MSRARAEAGQGSGRALVSIVLDSWAVLAWLQEEEPAVSAVEKLLNDARKHRRVLLMCVVNLGEVYYNIAKDRGVDTAEDVRRRLLGELPIRIVPVREPLMWRAARLKAAYPMSYADAFAAATAMQHHAPLVTGDPDFVPLETAGNLKVRWLSRDKDQKKP